MKKQFKTLITILIILAVALVSFFVIWNKITGAAVAVSPEVAQYIGSHSVLYIQTGCSHCVDQEALFGDSFKYLTVINCAETPEICIINNITATPTWVINGKYYEGVQSIDTLKKLTNYPN